MDFSTIYNGAATTILPQTLANFIIPLSPVFLAICLAFIFWHVWVRYIRAKFFYSQKYVLLEIRLPKDLMKSPLAMELFLTALHQTGLEGNWYAKYWVGSTRAWFSLEMVSIEGQVKFYIWSRAGNRSFIETSLYAQFPGIEVHEAYDYSKSVHFDPSKLEVWSAELEMTKDHAYPIKTYVDYGLDADPKEEFKVDPLAPLIEYLGGVGPNQQVWIQILVQAHKKETIKPGHFWKTTDYWKDSAEKIVNDMLKRDPKTRISGEKNDETGFVSTPTLTKHEQEIINSIERHMHKQAYDVGIRALYIAQKGFFNPSNIGGILGSWKQFSSEVLNGFKPAGTGHGQFEFPWHDFKNMRRNRLSEGMIAAYKRRSYFHPPYKGDSFVLTSEELATIFHFPGLVAGTPTFQRIPSRKGEAPSNLPI